MQGAGLKREGSDDHMHTLAPWEELHARLVHLAALAELLPEFVATASGAWLFREIAGEAETVARIADAYIAEAERAGLTTRNATTPPPVPWRPPTETEADQTAHMHRTGKPPRDEGSGAMWTSPNA